MGYSIGIGLTNNCNLDCAHCYRPTGQVGWYSFSRVGAEPVTSTGFVLSVNPAV